MRRLGRNLLMFLSIIIILFLVNKLNNTRIRINFIEYSNSKIPKSFEGFKIVQLSDLHDERYGKNQSRLIDKIIALNPDIILLTGDFIDEEIEPSIELVDGLKDYEIYYVSGNHEIRNMRLYEKLLDEFEKREIHVLNGDKSKLAIGDEYINILGLMDPVFMTAENNTISILEKLSKNIKDDDFSILLSHRPENIDIYKNYKIDLVFSGHTHGGQIRLPVLGGIIAPNQGFFPKYIDGLYEEGKTSLVINTGLGYTGIRLRTLNPPEIILVELTNE